MPHPMSDEVEEQLAGWSPQSRSLLEELLDDARSELQREFICRAVASAHTPPEVHAFADEMRPLSDVEAYEACTFQHIAAEGPSVAILLRAQADPLLAFELNGGMLNPNEGLTQMSEPPPRPAPRRYEIAGGPDEGSPSTVVTQSRVLGPRHSPPTPMPSAQPRAVTPFLAQWLAQSTRELSVSWKEHDIDLPGGLALGEALAAAAKALGRGLPVPAVIGPRPGEHRRFIVLMQCQVSGSSRAWQLYEPTTAELVWAHEGDLLAKVELPLVDKANRVLTRIVLPQSFRAAF